MTTSSRAAVVIRTLSGHYGAVDLPKRSLVVVRHAKSDWAIGAPDVERPLNKRGRQDAPTVGHWLASLGVPFDSALVSPARRTKETWQLLSRAAGLTITPQFVRGIYLGDASDLAGAVQELPGKSRGAILVGHSPGCHDFVEWATDGHGEELALARMREKWPTAGAAWLSVEGDFGRIAAGSARLLHFEVCRG
jgi:phosphohistidine phosphatase